MRFHVVQGPARITRQECGCTAIEVWQGNADQHGTYVYEVAGVHRPEDCPRLPVDRDPRRAEIASGFECPEGTRIIIQRPDGYFTAMVEGEVRVITHIHTPEIRVPDFSLVAPNEVVGVDFNIRLTATEGDHGYLYRLAFGKYPHEEDQ